MCVKGRFTLDVCLRCRVEALPRYSEHPGFEPAQAFRPHLRSLRLSSVHKGSCGVHVPENDESLPPGTPRGP
eukprot:169531-Rhodomonas_salina.1